MKENTKFTINKLDVARRELESSVRLFFSYGDMVAIHNLTFSAFTILRDLGAKSLILDESIDLIKKDSRKTFTNLFKKQGNYIKHADKDPLESLAFSPDDTKILLFDATRMYFQLTEESQPLFYTFQVWFAHFLPDVFIPSAFKDQANALKNELGLSQENREQYLALVLPRFIVQN